MPSFSAVIAAGKKPPYDTWTFLLIPDAIVASLGSKRANVRGVINDTPFAGTVAKGDGVYRMPLPRQLRERAQLKTGQRVRVIMEIDPEPRQIAIPKELEEVFAADAELARVFDQLPPAHRRAWATYIGEAKRPETRVRRAAKASAGIRSKSFPSS